MKDKLIDPVEFYEKYWKMADGSNPPPLSDWDKDFLRNAHKVPDGVIFGCGRQRKRIFLSEIIKEYNNKNHKQGKR